ncbi:hypothetical protein [Shewanella sp. GXUN23E]|uniref:hypothetical protein n=1 Tax=Shewanella sp. GXUN23E TaxID=3422498 RepID=UPI003D7CBE40
MILIYPPDSAEAINHTPAGAIRRSRVLLVAGFMMFTTAFFMIVLFDFVMSVLVMFMTVVVSLLGMFVTDRIATMLSVGMALFMFPTLVMILVVLVFMAIVVATRHLFVLKLSSMLNSVIGLFVYAHMLIVHGIAPIRMMISRLLPNPALRANLTPISSPLH